MRKHWCILAACGLLMLATPLAWAQHASPPATPPAAGHAVTAEAPEPGGEHGEDANKPALLQFDPGASVWSIIVFVLLLIVLRLTAWKPILRVLQERERFIAKSIADARHEREQAERLLVEYKAQLEKARAEASAIVAEGRRDAEVAARAVQEQARRESEEIVARARREIQLATDSARKELHDEASELAVRVAGRILRKELAAADHRALVAEALAEMQAAGRPRMN